MFCVFVSQKLYVIPVGNQSHIPYAKVNHNKYMVTDKVAYIGELQTRKRFMFHINIWLGW